MVMHNRETSIPRLDIVADMLPSSSAPRHSRASRPPDGDIVLDPGIGFGKSWSQHLEALRRLPEIEALGFPVLVGVSRKSMLGRLHDAETKPVDRLFGSLGESRPGGDPRGQIVRVHEWPPHVDALRVVDAVMGQLR